ncbi:MAG TPA: TonB family protein [Candidatus Acidoferrales bacterium]|nr:TonB family protein [Candidatus Acidoferrales bacterium]
MTEPAAGGEVAAHSQFDHYYRWDELDIGVSVLLKPEMLDRLQLEVLGGIENPRAAKEVGGILLGQVEFVKGRIRIVADEFEPVSCEHRTGPRYSLSAEDEPRFEATLARARECPERGPVGYYRSHNRDGLCLSTEDLRVISHYFTEPESVFLLVKTLPNRACTAGFFFWKDGRIQAEFTDSEVPLIPVAASAAEAEPEVAVPALQPEPPVPVEQPVVAREAAGGERRRQLIAALAVAGVLLTVVAAVARYRSASAGWRRREIPAAVALAPSSTPSLAAAPIPAASKPVPDTPARPETRPSEAIAAAPAPQSVAKEPAPPALRESTIAASPSAVRPYQPPVAKLPAAAVDLPAAPAATNSGETIPLPAVPAAQLPVPSRPVSPPPAPPARPVDAAPASPQAPAEAHTFVGPRVIHEVSPSVPRGVGPRMTGDVQVDVEVIVDAAGRVTGARVVSQKGAAASLLTIEALKAAQAFRFRPAQENGRDVSSVTVLTFHFERSGK